MKSFVRPLWVAMMLLMVPWKMTLAQQQEQEPQHDDGEPQRRYEPGTVTGHIVSCKG